MIYFPYLHELNVFGYTKSQWKTLCSSESTCCKNAVIEVHGSVQTLLSYIMYDKNKLRENLYPSLVLAKMGSHQTSATH